MMKTLLVTPVDKKKVEDLGETFFYESEITHQVEEDHHCLAIRHADLCFAANKEFLTLEQLKQYVINNYFVSL